MVQLENPQEDPREIHEQATRLKELLEEAFLSNMQKMFDEILKGNLIGHRSLWDDEMAQPIEENKAVQLIKAFLEQYPDSEWGFAHIVLSDYNLEDEWLDEIIQKGKAVVAAGFPEAHTVEFLEKLRLIPEDERVVDFYGDEHE